MLNLPNPTLPFTHVTSDATIPVSSAVIPTEMPGNNNSNTGLVYLHVAVDSDNRIFLRMPSWSNNTGETQYQWYVLDNTATDYPTGTIDDINCSFSFHQSSCVVHLIVLANDDVYQFTSSYATPGTGQNTYIWQIITPPGALPTLPQPF